MERGWFKWLRFYSCLQIQNASGIAVRDRWRSKTPSDCINKFGEGKHRARLLPMADFSNYGHPAIQEFVAGFDTIIVQRNLFHPQTWAACDYWRCLGKLVCGDLDDDYPRLTPQNPAHSFWILDVNGIKGASGVSPVNALAEGLRHLDALLSPSKVILQDWGDIVPGYLLPNYAQGEWYEGVEQKPAPQEEERIVIGWGGSVSHFDSWWFSGLRDAIVPLCEKYPRLHWRLCGNDWRLMRWAAQALPRERWEHQTGVSPQEWGRSVAQFDIGLAPLCGPEAPQAEAYDNHRSWLKAVEYLLCGVPWLASPGPVYEDLTGKGGFLVEKNTPEDWIRAISRVVDNLEQYRAASRDLMPWARDTLTMEKNVGTYIRLFERIQSEVAARHKFRLPDVTYVADMMGGQSNV